MFLHVEGIDVPQKLLFHVCFNDGRRIFYNLPDNLITLGETKWPDHVKGEIVKIFKEIGIREPLRQKLVEPYAGAFGGIKESSGACNLDRVNWGHLLDYFRWEAQAISSQDDNDESFIRAKELQDQACKKYGSKFFHYVTYASPVPL